MTTEIKAQIVGAALKLKEFRAVEITRDVGCSRQLVDYHLKNLQKNGYLHRKGGYYTVVNEEGLIDELTSGSTRKTIVGTVLLPHESNNKLLVQLVLKSRAMMLPRSMEFRNTVIDDINASIESLENMRYLIANNNADAKSLRRSMNDEEKLNQFVTDYRDFAKEFGIILTRRDIESQVIASTMEED